MSCHIVVLLPQYCLDSIGLGCSAFARHYLRNHFCFLLLWVLRCFSSPRSPPLRDDRPSTCRVAPFGNPGIKGYLHLHRAYRSLSRPSSPPRAKASTVCPCLLSLSTTPAFFQKPVSLGLIYLQLALFIRYLSFLKLSNTSKIFFIFFRFLWRIPDSNRCPSACKADALASCANPPSGFPFSGFRVVPGRVELPTSTLSV